MEVATDSRQHRIGANCLGGGFGQVGRDDRVVVGPGSAHHQPLEQRVARGHQFQQLDGRDHAGDLTQEGK